MRELQDVLNSLVGRLKEHRAVYQQNEMAVRNQLINPTLRALGWDPENPSLVLHNISTDEGVPDYSLMKSAKRLLFLEAKKLSIDVERPDAIRQLAKYSVAEGTKFGLLTNGAVWLLVRSFQEGTTLAERVVWKADLEGRSGRRRPGQRLSQAGYRFGRQR
jgi:predicted type IV restriction endonuclease